jgi:hypothetical protein
LGVGKSITVGVAALVEDEEVNGVIEDTTGDEPNDATDTGA